MWDHEDVIESESQRNFFRAEDALIDFVLFFEIGDSLLDFLGLKTFALGLQIDFLHCVMSKLIINTPGNLDKNFKKFKKSTSRILKAISKNSIMQFMNFNWN